MTPKKKAKELHTSIDNVLFYSYLSKGKLRDVLLIMVDELIECTLSVDTQPPYHQALNKHCKEYWKQVKEEITKL